MVHDIKRVQTVFICSSNKWQNIYKHYWNVLTCLALHITKNTFHLLKSRYSYNLSQILRELQFCVSYLILNMTVPDNQNRFQEQ